MNRDEAIALLLSGEEGVGEFNEWCLKGESLPDLSHVDFDGANLAGAFFAGANLAGAGLNNTNLGRAFLQCTNLVGANLAGANLRSATLAGANLAGAIATSTTFADVNLSEVVGLENVDHRGPCSIGIDTLYKSGGNIPEVFLRGCGVPDELIAYLRALLGAKQAIEFYSCFISYSHKDEGFCKRLHSRMRDEHLRVWYAPKDMQSGKKLHEQVEQAIQVHDKLLLVLSDESMNSEWVETEIYHARQREQKEGRRVLFPIRLAPFARISEWKLFDADTGRDTAREIREYYIPDFSNWKDHDAFESAFTRLLGDLKEATAP